MTTRTGYLRNGRLPSYFARWAAGGAPTLGFDVGAPDWVREAWGKHAAETAGAGVGRERTVVAGAAFLGVPGTFL